VSGLEVALLVVLGLLVLFAAVLAAAETSLTHLGRARAQALEALEDEARDPDDEDDAATNGLVSELLKRRGQVLNPVLLLLVACHVTIAGIAGAYAFDHWGAGGLAIALALVTVLVFVVAEAAPKSYALARTDRASKRVAPFVRALALFFPLRWLTEGLIRLSNLLIPGRGRPDGPTVTEEELLALAGVAAEADVIEEEEQALIESIIEFGDTVAREIMVPRTDMVSVGADFRVQDAMEVAITHGFSRLPAFGEGRDDIVGIAYAKDLMKAEREPGGEDRTVTELMRPAHFVPETKRVAELLREMQAETFHIAVLVDEYGGTAGLVTLEDVIEELVGEIQDEFDPDETIIEPLGGGAVRVDARVPVDEINDLLGIDLPHDDWDSVGGLVFNLLGRVPVPGESVDVDGHRLCAEKVTGRRISKVCITTLDSTVT
jgi:CBS domain containing-hemolysin-like protein